MLDDLLDDLLDGLLPDDLLQIGRCAVDEVDEFELPDFDQVDEFVNYLYALS